LLKMDPNIGSKQITRDNRLKKDENRACIRIRSPEPIQNSIR